MEYLLWQRQGNVAEVILDRPPANALANEVISELDLLLDELENEPNVRVVLIYGKGRFFSAGADIKEFATVKDGKKFSSLASHGQQVFNRIEHFSKPVIAAIHGAALGGGLELAMSCHIRLVTENSKLGLPELSLGLVPGFAGSQRLPRYVGTGKAAEMLFTSEPISGSEAVQWGLANDVCKEEELLPRARELAAKIAKKSPLSLKAAIELLNYSKQGDFQKGMEKEAEWFGKVFESKDGQEGIKAFIEKRAPVFKGE